MVSAEWRQRFAIEAFARRSGHAIAPKDWFYDAAVRGPDPLETRPGFAALSRRIIAKILWYGTADGAIFPISIFTGVFHMSDDLPSEHADAKVAEALRRLDETLRQDVWQLALADLLRATNERRGTAALAGRSARRAS